MATKPLPSQTVLRQLLDYNPKTGKLTWRMRTPDMFVCGERSREWACSIWNKRFGGKIACDTPQSQGYRFGRIAKGNWLAHRIIWKWWHGSEPQIIDHMNGVKDDNRIANLRSVSSQENNRNMPLPRHNTSGHIGVTWCKRTDRWQVVLGANGRNHYVGQFRDIDEAVAARDAAMADLGFHKNHGR